MASNRTMTMKYKCIIFILILTLSFKLTADVGQYTSKQLLTAQKNGVSVIDIRTPEEWRQNGTIPKASKIMFFDQNRKPLTQEFMKEFKNIVTSKDQPFILVCRSGNRTGVVAKYLNENLGYTNAAHLTKGMNQWYSENLPIEK